MSNDNTLETALWLVAGGAAGYAAGRWLVEPRLLVEVPAPMSMPASAASSSVGARLKQPAPRALSTGPSGAAIPLDPYATSPAITGPSGTMQPIDPYADVPTVAEPRVAAPTRPAAHMPNASTAVDGPITKPSQLAAASTTPASPVLVAGYPSKPIIAAPSSAAFATSARVRRFDPVFARYRGSLPIEYLRALVRRESNGEPSVRAGSSIGLMQIVPVVLSDYNKRHGTAYRSDHLKDPATNVAIGCELLHLIIESYRKNHPRIRTLQVNWDSDDFVELLTFGWNAGHSEAGGVGRVARYLEALGAVDITIDQVSSHSKLAGASKHLSNPAKVAWCKSVAALYRRERALQPPSTLV